MTGGAAHHAVLKRQSIIGCEHRDIHHVFTGGDTLCVAVDAEGGWRLDEIAGVGRDGVVAVGAGMVRSICADAGA